MPNEFDNESSRALVKWASRQMYAETISGHPMAGADHEAPVVVTHDKPCRRRRREFRLQIGCEQLTTVVSERRTRPAIALLKRCSSEREWLPFAIVE